MTSVRPGASRQRSRKQLPAGWMRALDNVLILAGVGLVLSLSFLIIVLVTGQLSVPLIAGSAVDVIKRNVGMGHRIFTVALWIVALGAIVRRYSVDSVGYLVGLGGLACWLLLPMLVKSEVPDTAAPELQELAQALINSFQRNGGALLAVGFLRVVVGRIIVLAYRPQGALVSRLPSAAAIAETAEERTKARPSLMRKCWELHYCRGSLRVTCPRFREGISCWKKRSGCYCDQDLATRLLSTITAKARVQVAEELEAGQRRAQTYQRALAQQRQRARRKAAAPCRECPLYLDHQQYKYRTLSWFAYPVAAGIIGLLIPRIHNAYQWVEVEVGGALARMQILPHGLTDAPLEHAAWLSAENAIIFMLGVLMVAVILQLTELAVFHFKW